MIKLVSHSPEETQQYARVIAKKILALAPLPSARVILLLGDLGAGKTTFTQGFARALGVKRRLTSPTFVIMKRHALRKKKLSHLYHLDAYRVDSIEHLTPLKFPSLLKNPHNLILIEWANNLKGARWKHPIRITFRHKKRDQERIITVSGL